MVGTLSGGFCFGTRNTLKVAISGETEPVAVVGLSCRLPGGADNPESFWDILEEGRDCITPIPPQRWNHALYHHPHPDAPGRTLSAAGGFLDSVFGFDAGFFGISPREAESIDPQHRLLLELAFEAIERGGETLRSLAGRSVGVFTALSSYDMYYHAEAFGTEIHTATGVSPSMAANRISYSFDLRGPSLNVDSACSASLTALDLACRSLRSGQCELALVGAVNLLLDPALFLAFSRLNMLSPSQRCRVFDETADGFVRGEGAVMFLLKPLSKAVLDKDRVEAVILATALNQDGRSEGITVPNQKAQESLLGEVYADPKLRSRLFAIEAHGTGTPVGDPIELQAISSALGAKQLWIGSVKSNIGHLEGAAGAAGLLKAILCLKRQLWVPNLHFNRPPPGVDLKALGLGVSTKPLRIPDNSVVGVSAFGFGGSSGHVVVAAPPSQEVFVEAASHAQYVLPLSARSAGALRARVQQFQELLEDDLALPDLVHTVACHTSHFSHRAAFVAADVEDFRALLGQWLEAEPGRTESPQRGPVFVFCGQGPQWWGMGRELRREHPAFRRVIEECDCRFKALGGWSLVELLETSEATSLLRDTRYAQPAIFALQAALVELWRSWGVHPVAVVGHSVGEIAAAYTAGILSLEQATEVIFWRAATMEEISMKGGMLALEATEQRIREMLSPWAERLEIGAVNSPHSVVVSGDSAAVMEFRQVALDQGVSCREIPVQYAFHSRLVEPMREALLARLSGLAPEEGGLPLISSVRGHEILGRDMGADYWWQNARRRVQFGAAVDRLLSLGHDLFVEVGPHPVLTAACLDCAEQMERPITVVASLYRGVDQNECLLGSLATLWSLGQDVDWPSLYSTGRRVLLPAYPWQRTSHRSYVRDRDRGFFAEKTYELLGKRCDHSIPSWETIADRRLWPFLAKSGEGTPVLLELALEAADSATGPVETRGWTLSGLRFPSPLSLDEDTPVSLQTCFEPGSGRVSISTPLAGRGQRWSLLMEGKCTRTATVARPPPTLPSGLKPVSWSTESCSGNSICEVQGDEQCLAFEFDWPEDPGFVLPPVALQRTLIETLSYFEALRGEARQVQVLSIDQIQIVGLPRGRVRVLGQLQHPALGPSVARVELFDDQQVLLTMEGIHWGAVSEDSASSPLMAQRRWVKWGSLTPQVHLDESALDFGSDVRLFEATDGEPVDQLAAVLSLVKQAATEQGSPRWVLVTRGAQSLETVNKPALSQAPLLGFWRSVQLEYPRFRPLMVDLPAQPKTRDRACLEQCLSGSESEVVVREGVAWVPRWQRLDWQEARQLVDRPAWNSQRTYLISGGLSGMGGALARWLVHTGAMNLCLLGRRGLKTPGGQALFDELTALGARVWVLEIDVCALQPGDPGFQQFPPIGGVFHTANQMDDGIIAELDRNRLERVFMPKGQGAWSLHRLSLKHPVEHFVMFSSISGIFGAIGQANYCAANAYLEAVLSERRAQQLPGLVVHWGPIEDVGYLARHPQVLKSLKAHGHRPLLSDDCLSMLGRLMTLGVDDVLVKVGIGPNLIQEPYGQLMRRRLDFEASKTTTDIGNRRYIRDFLIEQGRRILRIPNLGESLHRSLRQQGLDSVMAVEFRNAIERKFNLAIPIQNILKGPSLVQLEQMVADLLAQGPPNEPVSSLPHLSDAEVREMLAQLESGERG